MDGVAAFCEDTCAYEGNTKGHGLWEEDVELRPSDYEKPLPKDSPVYHGICEACVGNDAPCCHNHPHEERRGLFMLFNHEVPAIGCPQYPESYKPKLSNQAPRAGLGADLGLML